MSAKASPMPLVVLGLGFFAVLTVYKTGYDRAYAREKRRRIEASPLYDLGL